MQQPMPGQWIVSAGGKQYGPYDDTTIRRMFAEGRVPADAMVWQPGMPTWMPASQLAGGSPRMGTVDPHASSPAPRPRKSKVLAAIIGFFLPGMHRVYLGKGVWIGVTIFAASLLLGCIASIVCEALFGPLGGLACVSVLGILCGILAVIDALVIKAE